MSDTTDTTRLGTILLLVIAALLIVPMLFMGFGPMMGGMWGSNMWHDTTTPGWIVLLGFLMQLLFLGAVLVGGYLLIRALTRRDNDTDQALEELRLAYARGDLTEDEYEQRRDALERDA